MKQRALVFGVGKMADWWLNLFLPELSDRCEIVGLVDLNEEALRKYGKPGGLWPHACYPSIGAAFEAIDSGAIDPTCCFVILPPDVHFEAIMGCLDRDIPVLSEKPLSDRLSECIAIGDALRPSHKVAVVQNYRHSAGVQAARKLLADGAIGQPYSVSARFRADYREFGSWDGPARHQVPHPILLDAAIHHLDLLRFLTGQEFLSLVCEEWRPPGVESFAGGCCVNLIARMSGGLRATYEANVVCGGEQRSWTGEEFRVEGSTGALHVIGERLWTERISGGELVKAEVQLEPMRYRHHLKTIVDFLDWLEGEDVEVSTVADNLGSLRAIFAAVKSVEDGAWVRVDTMGTDG
jgi:predicted dehydrogenase